MRKFLLALYFCFAASGLQALPLGNPLESTYLCQGVFCDSFLGDPSGSTFSWCAAWSLRAGFYGDYVFNRYTEVDRKEDDSDIYRTKINTNAGYLAINLWDRLDFFGTLGATKVTVKSMASVFRTATTTTGYVTVETQSAFSGSVGARLTLWECSYFILGAEGQYFYSKPHIDHILSSDDAPAYPEDADLTYKEWQGGVGISVPINIPNCGPILIPYIGAKYSHADIDMNNLQDTTLDIILYDVHSKKPWGCAVGLSIVGNNTVSFTLEGRFSDELAAYLNGQVRF